MPIQAIEPRRLYQEVADQIGALIARGEFPVGTRLPPERDLARLLSVSRPVVREALIALEIAGVVDVRSGSGSYVRALPRAQGVAFSVPDGGPGPFDLLAARRLIEGETAALAAERASPDDLAAIAESVAAFAEAMVAGGSTRPADRAFHQRIAAATGNLVLVSVVDQLWCGMFEPVFDGLSRFTGLTANLRTTHRDHTLILDRLRARDATGARSAMHDHLTQVERVLLSETEPN